MFQALWEGRGRRRGHGMEGVARAFRSGLWAGREELFGPGRDRPDLSSLTRQAAFSVQGTDATKVESRKEKKISK